jgi:hypothetical protein
VLTFSLHGMRVLSLHALTEVGEVWRCTLLPLAASQVEPGPFVGQLVLLPWDPAAAAVAAGGAAVAAALAGLPSSGAAAAAGVTRRLSEAQFEAHLEAMEAGVQQSRAAIDLLRTAQEALQSSGERSGRRSLTFAAHVSHQAACKTSWFPVCNAFALTSPTLPLLTCLATATATACPRSAGRRTGKTLRHAQQLLGRELLEAGEVGAAAKLLAEVAGGTPRWCCCTQRRSGADRCLSGSTCGIQRPVLRWAEPPLSCRRGSSAKCIATSSSAEAPTCASALSSPLPAQPLTGTSGGRGPWPPHWRCCASAASRRPT